MWVSTVWGLSQSVLQMPWFERPSAIRAIISRFTWCELGDGIDPTPLGEQLVDDGSVDDGLTGCDPLHSIEELLHAADTFLHQVADPFGPLLEEPHRVGGLEVLREHEDRRFRIARTNDACCAEPFVGVGGRHADVDEGDVGAQVAHAGEERIGVAHLVDDLEPALRE
jgi:hypothetical protein